MTRFARVAPYLLGGVARSWAVMVPFEARREAHRGVVVHEGAWTSAAIEPLLTAAKAEVGLAVHVRESPGGLALDAREVDRDGVVRRHDVFEGPATHILVDVARWLDVPPAQAGELLLNGAWIEPYVVALDVLCRASGLGVNQAGVLERALVLLPTAVDGRAALVFGGFFFTLLKDTPSPAEFRDLGLRLARRLDRPEVWRALLELSSARRERGLAETALERVAALCPDDHSILLQLAVARVRAHDPTQARRLLEGLFDDAAMIDLAQAYLGVVEMQQGEIEAGCGRWQRLVADGGHPHAVAIARENLRRFSPR